MLPSCKPKSSTSAFTTDAASKVYVAPGSYDEFYNFVSGGFSGQLAVYGIPLATPGVSYDLSRSGHGKSHGWSFFSCYNSDLDRVPAYYSVGHLCVMGGNTNKPFYCTDFCSAMHQEMQGYARVSPAGSDVQLSCSFDDKPIK